MSIRDELLKWANNEQARGNPVSIQEIAEHAQGLAQKQEAGALRLLADIRMAAGDPHGRLMQDELVDHIVELNKKVAENDALARELEVERHHRRAVEESEQALAAHVERTDTPATILIENMQEAIELLRAAGDAPNIVALTDTLGKAVDDLAGMLNDNPETSLDRLKAQCQAEALESLLAEAEGHVTISRGALIDRVRELHRQAEVLPVPD